jgi:glycosyltransferase involved in cell wall biosynthesis
MRRAPRILVIANVDIMVWGFLVPALEALCAAGWEIHVACRRGPYFDRLAERGFRMWDVPVHRGWNPLRNLPALAKLYRLLRALPFDVINTHSPVASAVGRVAAWLAGRRHIVCSVHGFYFHDETPLPARKLLIGLEWLLGRVTDRFLFVSEEDRKTALATGIARTASQTETIPNGVDLELFRPRSEREPVGDGSPVIGIVGRLVVEKGYREFFEMARRVARVRPDARFLVVGDCLPSDRHRLKETLHRWVRQAGLEERFVFTGHTNQVARYLRQMDVFTLPSYREGLPVSILEAMATGLPVVASDIRGCREAVVAGETGLLVPPKDAAALTQAVLALLANPELARRMGEAGRRRALALYDRRVAQRRYVAAIEAMLGDRAPAEEIVSYASS